MNRKLQDTILAFSLTGVTVFAFLMAAQPPASAPGPGLPSGPVAGALDTRIGTRADLPDGAPQTAGAAGETLSLAAGLAAAALVESALDARPQDVAGAVDSAEAGREPRVRQRRGSARDVIAVPYFSFGRGQGRGGRS